MKPKQKHTGVLNIVRGVMSDFGGPMTAHEIQSLSELPIKTVRNAIFQLVVHNDARKEKELKDGYIAYSINKSREEAKKNIQAKAEIPEMSMDEIGKAIIGRINTLTERLAAMEKEMVERDRSYQDRIQTLTEELNNKRKYNINSLLKDH